MCGLPPRRRSAPLPAGALPAGLATLPKHNSPKRCLPVLRPCRSTACHPSDAPPAACRGTVCLSCDPAEAQLAEALSAGLAALPEHCLPERCLPKYRQLTSAARPKFRLPVLRPCRSTARRSAARRSCGPPEHCLPERCLPKYRQLTSAARPKFRLPVLRLCRSTARRSAARRPRYAKKRSSSSRAAMSDSAMRRLSFDLSV